MKKLFINLLVLGMLLTSCSRKLYNKGSLTQNDFLITIPFETRADVIVLKVDIEGITYDFLLDTGAPNVVSTSLAEKIKPKIIKEIKVDDVHRNTKKMNICQMAEIDIAGLKFCDNTALVLDLDNGPLRCLEVDGFVGSNLMRYAIWDFDFKNKNIIITNDEAKLNIPKTIKPIKIKVGNQYNVFLPMMINGEKSHFLLDLGNGGKTHLNQQFYEYHKEKFVSHAFGNGQLSIGAFGTNTLQKIEFTKVKEIKIGDLTIDNHIVEIKGQNNIGLDFFRDYRLIINWKKKTVKLIPNQAPKKEWKSFGFAAMFDGTNHLNVVFLYENTKASELLKIGDRILKINEVTYVSTDREQACDLFRKRLITPFENENQISITILRDNKKLTFSIPKEKIL